MQKKCNQKESLKTTFYVISFILKKSKNDSFRSGFEIVQIFPQIEQCDTGVRKI